MAGMFKPPHPGLTLRDDGIGLPAQGMPRSGHYGHR